MAAIYSNGGNRWNILGFNFTKRDALSSVYKISMGYTLRVTSQASYSPEYTTPTQQILTPVFRKLTHTQRVEVQSRLSFH
jgi:hypothetical protein